MTGGRRPLIPLLIGMTAVCVGLAFNVLSTASRPPTGRESGRLDVSSLDLATGVRQSIISASDMMPGDVVTAAVTVVNSTDRAMTYAMSRGPVSANGAALASALILTIRTIGSSCVDFDGAVLYDAPLGDAAFGGESDGRTIAPATADILCFRASLPLEADDRLQGASTTVALAFGATWQAALR